MTPAKRTTKTTTKPVVRTRKTTTRKKVSTTPKKPATKTATAIPDLPVNPFTFEVFDLVNKQRSGARKVEALRKFDHPSLRSIFIWNFDDSVISLLPPGVLDAITTKL